MTRLNLATLAAALLTAAAPANAQSIYPASSAVTFCNLRSVGISQKEALAAAVRENLNSDRPYMVQHNGTPTDTNILLMANYIARRCPEHVN